MKPAQFPPAHVVSTERLTDLDAAALKPVGADHSFISPRIVSGVARILESIVIAITGVGIAAYYPGFGELANPALYLPMIAVMALAFPLAQVLMKGYSVRNILHPLANVSAALVCWAALFASLAVSLFASKIGQEFSRVWLASWLIIGGGEILLFRFFYSHLVRRWNQNGQLNRHAVLVGGGEPARQLYLSLQNSTEADVTVVGIFDDRDDERSPPHYAGLHKLGNISQLIDYVRSARVDVLMVTLPIVAEARLLQIIKRLWVLPVDIRLCAQNQQLRYQRRAYSYVGNVPFLDVFDKPLGDWGAVIKSLEDKVIAAIALVVLAPVMALIALAVRLDSKGPVLFRQMRYGFNNELIGVYKFRSMYHAMTDFNADRLATRDDPRVTRVGRFIRRTSLDELPQLFNVLMGSLSLVGPRPHATKAKAAEQLYTEVVDGYFARHKVKPGITGWAQINGWRGETDTTEKLQRRVEHDIYYIENWSLLFDLYILAKTPFALMKGENAY
jgi:Undecaprenyl-phosphate glucose phosphotransferase